MSNAMKHEGNFGEKNFKDIYKLNQLQRRRLIQGTETHIRGGSVTTSSTTDTSSISSTSTTCEDNFNLDLKQLAGPSPTLSPSDNVQGSYGGSYGAIENSILYSETLSLSSEAKNKTECVDIMDHHHLSFYRFLWARCMVRLFKINFFQEYCKQSSVPWCLCLSCLLLSHLRFIFANQHIFAFSLKQ